MSSSFLPSLCVCVRVRAASFHRFVWSRRVLASVQHLQRGGTEEKSSSFCSPRRRQSHVGCLSILASPVHSVHPPPPTARVVYSWLSSGSLVEAAPPPSPPRNSPLPHPRFGRADRSGRAAPLRAEDLRAAPFQVPTCLIKALYVRTNNIHPMARTQSYTGWLRLFQ